MNNVYKTGTLITAKSHPERKLVINRYTDRIYYCRGLNDPNGKLLAYYERELVPPGKSAMAR